ncbi:MAG: deoxynucleoside kinase [Candidatus Hodarchaeales archaeon]|jgi:deoxyadenosine/deoxycytidine kinase
MIHYKPIIWVEGIIGSGKSTFSKMIAKELRLRLIKEPVDNEYLTIFYENPKRWAFPMQIDLLHKRFSLQKLAVYEASLAAVGESEFQGVVLDRGLPGDRVFARLHMLEGNISEVEWRTYQRAYETMTCSLIPPTLMIFLDVEPLTAFNRVKNRDRSYERAGVPIEYQKKLQQGYMDLLAEIDSGQHAWSRGIEVMRIPWNSDHQPIENIVQLLRKKYELE